MNSAKKIPELENLPTKELKYLLYLLILDNKWEAYRRVWSGKTQTSANQMHKKIVAKEDASLILKLIDERIAERALRKKLSDVSPNDEQYLPSHIENLKKLRQLAEITNNVTAAINAEEKIGKAVGIYRERKHVAEVQHLTEKSTDELGAYLDAMVSKLTDRAARGGSGYDVAGRDDTVSLRTGAHRGAHGGGAGGSGD